MSDDTLERAPRIRWWHRPHLAFAAIALLGGTAFIVMNPPFWGNDTVSQYSRAYQISHGHLLPQEIEWFGKGESYGGTIPMSVQDVIAVAGEDISQHDPEPAPLASRGDEYDELLGASYDDDERQVVWFTNTAQYSPVPYLPAAAVSLAAELLGAPVGLALLGMALACLISYVLPITLALRSLGAGPTAWVMTGVALIPPALLQASGITADAMTNGFVIAFAALFAKGALLRERLTRFDTALLLLAVVIMPLGKPTYILLSAMVFLIPRERWSVPRWLVPGAFALSTALWATWTVIVRDLPSVNAFYRADYETSEFGTGPMIQDTLNDPLHFVGNLARTFFYRENFLFLDLIGGSGVRVPSIVMLVTAIVLTIAALNLPRFTTTKVTRWSLVAVSVISTLGLFATLYVSFTPVGYHVIDGVQGRYFFALWPFFILTLLAWCPLRLEPGPRTAVIVPRLLVSALSVGIALTLVKFYGVVWGTPW